MTGGGDGGGGVEDVAIFIRSDKNGQDQEWVGTAQVGKFGDKTREAILRWYGVDTYGGKMMGILGKGCWGWSCQERGNGEGQKGGLWMWWKRTWLRLKWRRKIQLIETTGEGKSAVVTPDGKSRKKKNPTKDHNVRSILAEAWGKESVCSDLRERRHTENGHQTVVNFVSFYPVPHYRPYGWF